MPNVTAYLACGCAILEDGARSWCPTHSELSSGPIHPGIQGRAIEDILAERVRQDIKWGEQNHDPFTWLVILLEEVGEASKSALEYRFSNAPDKGRQEYHDELVQVGAVTVAMLECLTRDKWLWGEGVKR